MKSKWLAMIVAASAVASVQAQTGTGIGASSRAGASSSSDTQQQAPAYRSMPSRPSGPSGPSVSGSGLSMPDTGSAPGGQDSSSIGGSGSAGLAAMGVGAMTDCPLGTSRKMGLCVPYGQTHKKQP